MGKTETQILKLLSTGSPLTLNEIANNLGKTPKTIFKSLRKLFQNGEIICDAKTRQYTLEKEEHKEEAG